MLSSSIACNVVIIMILVHCRDVPMVLRDLRRLMDDGSK